MSTQPTIPTPQIANPLLYIALSPNTNNPQEPDPIHWSILIAPSSEPLPAADALLYTYTAHDNNNNNIITSPIIINSARVWKLTRIPLRPPPPLAPESATTTTITTPTIVARLLIAEVSSLDTLHAHILAWSERDVPPVTPTAGYKSVTGVMGVLEKLQKLHEKGDENQEEEEEGGGSGVGGKGSEKKCLGRRMGSFGSVEAEGRQFFKAVTTASSSSSADGGSEHGEGDGDVGTIGVPSSVEAVGVPTRVLFDRWGPWAVGAGKRSGSVEAAGKEGGGSEVEGTKGAGKEGEEG